jgi:hypothetical protein
MESWAGCIAGALQEDTYRTLLQDAGFVDVDLEVTRRYNVDEVVTTAASTLQAELPDERRGADGHFPSPSYSPARRKTSSRDPSSYHAAGQHLFTDL